VRRFSQTSAVGSNLSSGRTCLLTLVVLALCLLALAPAAQASKNVISWVGGTTTGTLGAQFSTPRGVAVNSSGLGTTAGDYYVADSANHRIQQFKADGSFLRAWGYDVIQAGKPGDNDALQALTVSATAGQFKLTFNGQTTTDLAAGASAATVQSALQALSTVGAGNATVVGGPGDAAGARPYLIDFTATLGGAARPAITTSNGTTPLSGGSASATVAVLNPGGATGFEVCTVAENCKAGINTVSPAPGGEFSTPQGLAVDQSDGSIYVTDQGFLRVEKFSAVGVFIEAFGQDVVNAGPGDNPATAAKQNLTVDASGGAFTLTFKGQSTGDIAWNASATTIQTALQGLSTIGSGNATVTGSGPYAIAFAGALLNSPQPLILGASSAGNPLTGGTTQTATVANTTTGSSGFEICTKASTSCKTATSATSAGAFATTFNGYPAVAPPGSPNAGRVIVPDPANRRVQEFTPAGAFVDAFGFDVAKAPTGTGTTFEVCSAANFDVCQIGAAAGTGNGQFGTNAPNRAAVDDAGRIYAIDNANNRIQRFTSTPAFDTLYGTTQLAGSPAPTDIAIDPGASAAGNGADDHVFVVKPCSTTVTATLVCPAGSLPPPFSTTERRIKELDTSADPAAAIDVHMAGAGIAALNGLGMNTASDRLFVSSITGGHRLYAVDNPLPTPLVTMDPITVKTDTTATFSGTVDPQGGQVNCKFQYSTDQAIWTDVSAPGCATLANNGGAQALSQAVTGLVPNTHYFVRLVVTRPYPPASSATSALRAFNTSSVAPVVTDVGAVEVEDVSARLVGTIDPKHAATGYVFEYGTTPALGSATAPLGIGAGSTPVTVSQLITGLAPSTTYYFRLLATNAFGSTVGTGASFQTRAEPSPPVGGRRYEMVSPLDKGLANVEDAVLTNYKFTAAEDGEALSYCNASAGGAQVGVYCGDYISQRGADGWHARVIAPPACGQDHEATEPTEGGQKRLAISKELDYAVIGQPEAIGCGVAPLSPSAPLPGNNLYRQSLGSSTPAFDLLTPSLSPGPAAPARSFNTSNGKFVGASDDFSRIVIESAGDECYPVACGLTVGTRRLFEWSSASGEIRLVSQGSSVSLAEHSALGGNPDPMTGPRSEGYGAVSASGGRIYFQSPVNGVTGGCVAANCELYLREGASTYKASEQECSPACGNGTAPDFFKWANPAGSAALFTTTAKLVDADPTSAANTDLYMYRHGPNPAAEQNLSLLSTDSEPADGTSPEVRGILGMSDSGDVVYFVANGQLVAGEPTAAGPKIYRWSWSGGSPTLRYLASVGGSEQFLWQTDNNIRPLVDRVSTDGRYLLVDTVAALNPAGDRDGDRDVYRWGEAGGWTCLSCQVPGVPSAGESNIKALSYAGLQDGQTQNAEAVRVASADGERVFFTSPDALLPADTNGASACPAIFDLGGTPHLTGYRCQDVYEWHDGRLGLVSSGTGSTPARLAGIGADGRDVFFLTADRLVGWDTDNLFDAYDARIGGGFPEPEPTPAPCEGEACRAAAAPAPPSEGPGTASFQAPVPTPGPTKCRKGTRKVRLGGKTVCRKQRKRHSAKHSSVKHSSHRAGAERGVSR
jgi:hypothetical protein